MLKNKIESLLFSSGRKMSIEELSKLSRSNPDDIKQALVELKNDYDERKSSTMLVNEGDSWKLTIREQYLSLVQKIVTETELSKTIMETLAVIAFKYPIKQSDLIKIRTNKAYDHLKELQELGYISRQKHGRTNLIKLTEKFFEYFDLPKEKLKDQFQDFKSIAMAIEEKEQEIETIKQEQKARAEEEKNKDIKMKEAAENVEEEDVESYGTEEKPKIDAAEEKLGNLEVVDEPSEEELEKERKRIEGLKEEDKQQIEEKKEKKKKPKSNEKGIQTDDEMERAAEKRAEEIMNPKEENISCHSYSNAC